MKKTCPTRLNRFHDVDKISIKRQNIEYILYVEKRTKRYVCVSNNFNIRNEFKNLYDNFLLNRFCLKKFANNIIIFFVLYCFDFCFLL